MEKYLKAQVIIMIMALNLSLFSYCEVSIGDEKWK